MSYFQILQVTTPQQIKPSSENEFSISFSNDRFLKYTDEDIRIFYKNFSQDNINLLKKYPAFITIERFENEIVLAKIISINIDENNENYIVNFLKINTIKITQWEEITYKSREESKAATKDYKEYLDKLRQSLQFGKLEEYEHHWAIKKGDIFATIQSETHPLNNFRNYLGEFPNKSDQLPLPQIISPEPITTSMDMSVNLTTDPSSKVSEFILEVIKKNNELATDDNEIFYRGHGDADKYLLQPSLFRQYDDKGTIYLESEHNSYRELLTIEPNSFVTDSCCFEVLTRMQHYSLPTRLLDISSNPLTALYFACETQSNVDGEVILVAVDKSNINYYDSDKVSCLTNLAKLNGKQKQELKSLITRIKNTQPDQKILDESLYNSTRPEKKVYSQLIHYIRQEKSYFQPKIEINDLEKILCVKGRLNQDRIIAQSGSFLLFGLKEQLHNDGDHIYTIKRIRIPADQKSRILKELDMLKINSRTVYPSIESSSKYLKQQLEKKADSK